MKFTIEGFSQEFTLTLQKEINVNGKLKKIKVDCNDLVILRWFVDFYPKMMKVEIDGKQYAWIKYQSLLDDLPLLDIKKRILFDRLQKLVYFEVLSYKSIKSGGTFSYYGFGKNYSRMIETLPIQQMQKNAEGMQKNAEGVCNKLQNLMQKNAEQINTSIKDNTNTNNTINKRKKESAYDEIIDLKVQNDEVKENIYEFIKMRSLIKKPLTNKGLELIIDKLKRLSNNSYATAIKILQQSIINSWQGIFELKTEPKKTVATNYTDEDLKRYDRVD